VSDPYQDHPSNPPSTGVDSVWSSVGGATQWVANSGSNPSVFDVTSGPYNAKVDGATDDTAAWTAALADAVAYALNGHGAATISCPKAGVSLIHGPSLTGTALSYSYAGQILIPAVPLLHPIAITIKGPGPIPILKDPGYAEQAAAGGLILQSNATTGYVFDCIPSFDIASTVPFTNVMLTFEDVGVRLPDDPQAGGCNFSALARLRTRGTFSIDTTADGLSATFPTGTLPALTTPAPHSAAMCHLSGDVQIVGFPIGILAGEHFLADNCSIEYCKVAVRPKSPSSHATKFTRLLVQECQTVFQVPDSTFGGYIEAFVDMECAESGTWQIVAFIDDANAKLLGNISYVCTTDTTKGLPMIGGYNINLRNLLNGGQGFFGNAPYDTFTRIVDVTASSNIGSTDQTSHPWHSFSGTFTTLTGTLKAAQSGIRLIGCRYLMRDSCGSRTVTAKITTGSSYACGLFLGRNAAGNYLYVELTGGAVTINKMVSGAATNLATSSAGVVAASTLYTVTVIYTQTPGSSWAVNVLINGTSVATYTLTSTDMSDLANTNTPDFLFNDGYWVSSDQLSAMSLYKVAPAIA